MKHKTLGQVFTPDWIVNEILNLLNYNDDEVLKNRIIDPACGDGAFLKNIVERIIDLSIKRKYSISQIKKSLENNVYGIEIDTVEYNNCIANLNNLIKKKINTDLKINWNIYKDNTLLKYKDFIGFFDFVVGNPPYIRIHNLDSDTRNILKNDFKFSDGTIDIYVSFFELGFKLLNKKGQLGYITPNSYLHNSSYKNFRKYLKENKIVKSITDFKSNKLFRNFSTYTAITTVNFYEKNNFFTYREFKEDKIIQVNQIKFNDVNDNDWSFSSREDMEFLKIIYSTKYKKISDFFDVQYGFATLRDRIYIGNITDKKENLVLFNNSWIEKEILYKIIKASTFKGKKEEYKYIIFPYKKNNSRFVPFTENELMEKYPNTYKYLLINKDELIKRDIDQGSNWYEFGRSQGIQTSNREKLILSTLVKDGVNFYKVDKDTFIYSGIFIIKKSEDIDWGIVENVLNSNEFLRYIQITGKDFSGGYKSITSHQIKNYPTNIIKEQSTLFN